MSKRAMCTAPIAARNPPVVVIEVTAVIVVPTPVVQVQAQVQAGQRVMMRPSVVGRVVVAQSRKRSLLVLRPERRVRLQRAA